MPTGHASSHRGHERRLGVRTNDRQPVQRLVAEGAALDAGADARLAQTVGRRFGAGASWLGYAVAVAVVVIGYLVLRYGDSAFLSMVSGVAVQVATFYLVGRLLLDRYHRLQAVRARAAADAAHALAATAPDHMRDPGHAEGGEPESVADHDAEYPA